MMYTMYKRFVEEGILPNLKKLGDEGIVTESYSSLPAWTPTNWATLMTGAHTGTHTVSRWFLNLPNPRDQDSTVSAFVGAAVAAETIFEAADKAGLKSVAVHYPAAAPSRAELAHTIDGFGHPGYGTSPFEITPAWGYTNIQDIDNAYRVKLNQAEGWQNLPASKSRPLEFPIDIVTKREGENQELVGLAIDAHGSGYDTVVVCVTRDGKTELGRSGVGQWSEWIGREFVVEGKKQDAAFRIKTVELATDASRLRLYRSQIIQLDDFCEPPELGRELVERFGPYLEHASELPFVWGIADLDTCYEEVAYQCQWIANVGKYLFEEKGFSLLYTHIHLFDYINHDFNAVVDPFCPGYDPEKAEEGWDAYREAYKIADQMFGTLLEGVPEDTAIVVVSDHGVIPQFRATDVFGLLRDNGYLALKDSSDAFDPNEDVDNIDMERTKVFVTPVRSFEIFVNAPEASEEYTRIQDEVLTLLRTWVDKSTGKCPVVVALPKSEAPLLGFWGDQCGDIVYFMEKGYVSGYPSGKAQGDDPYVWIPDSFGAYHGPYLPTARTEVSSNMAFFLAWGSGLKKGYERPSDKLGYMHQTDVVPIVCHLLGIDPPDQAQGTVPRDFLEGTEPFIDRPTELPGWEWGTRLEGWGDRVWTQKRDMFEGFMPGYERRET